MTDYINFIYKKIKNNPFPSFVIATFIILTAFGVSGSSMGYFDQMFLGKTTGILLGIPRPIRSDEWLVSSQEALIQKTANYPSVNKNIGLGQDMSIVNDVPFKSFFSAFKPDNLFFFVMPYTNAFAAHWWFMSLVLVLGFYYLMDTLFPRKRIIISLAATILLLNPFVQWWYQSITLLSIGYALWACLIFIKIFDEKTDYKKLILYSLGLAYTTICFIFILYPPFQISITYVIISFLIGYFYHRYFVQHIKFNIDTSRWLGVLLAIIITIIISGIFYISHKTVINTVVNTAYPGARNIVSGQYGNTVNSTSQNMIYTFSAPILFNLQNQNKAITIYNNQSEASRIVLINIFLLPIFLLEVLRKPKNKKVLSDYLLISTTVATLVFLIRMFTPFFNLPFKFLLLNEVENERLIIGLILLCVIQLVLFGTLIINKITVKKSVIIALSSLFLSFDSSMMFIHQYPNFISPLSALIDCSIIGLAVFMIFQKKYMILGLSIFMIFCVASSVFVNPLYSRGEPLALSASTKFIKNHYRNNKSWIVFDSVVIENIPAIAGEHSLSGVQTYPQLSLWKRLSSSQVNNFAYNRYAHVIFSPNVNPNNSEFYNPQQDVTVVHFDCSVASKLPNFGYALSSSPISNPSLLKCLKLSSSIKYPKVTLDIYKYN